MFVAQTGPAGPGECGKEGGVNRVKRLFALVAASLVGSWAAAQATTPAEALDVSQVATQGVANLTEMVSQALPYVVAAIGLGIVLRWARRIFKF